MTTGEKLKKTLGLDKFRDVYISRLILPHSQKINIIYYDSFRTSLTKNQAMQSPYVAMGYSGKDLKKDHYKKPKQTPLLDIESWNGDPSNYIFFTIDISYQRWLDTKSFTKLPESIQDNKKSIILFPKGKIKEFVTFNDLKNSDVIAPSTFSFRKERNKIMGTENRTAKLIDCFIDEALGSITFAFLTEVTDKYEDDYEYQEVDPYSLDLKRNRSKTYELQFKILDFFDWLDTNPDKTSISNKDIKDILQVANVQVFSTSPSWQYQSYNYNMSQLDGSIYPTNIAPKVWDKRLGGDYFLDKHLYGLIRGIDFFLNPMASMLTKKLKDRGLI